MAKPKKPTPPKAPEPAKGPAPKPPAAKAPAAKAPAAPAKPQRDIEAFPPPMPPERGPKTPPDTM